MVGIASIREVTAAVTRARSVVVSAYTLRRGALLDALERAARDGVRIRVRLEGRPYDDSSGELLRRNRAAVAALQRSGADARLADLRGDRPVHMKAVICDRVAYLDDRNFDGDGKETIVRDDYVRDVRAVRDTIVRGASEGNRFFVTRKRDALREEGRLLYDAGGAREVEVESESFGYSGETYAALLKLARKGVRCRLLVARRDNADAWHQAVLQRLENAGVDVRLGDSDEKMALVDGARAWVGSANATEGVPNQSDWGLRTDAPEIVRALRAHFSAEWHSAKALVPTSRT